MTTSSFIHVNAPASHPGVDRFEAAVDAARGVRRGFNGARGIAAMLLAAIVAAMLVVADQVIGTWADGDLLAAWIMLWLVAFAALAIFAGTARRAAAGVVATLDAWSERVAKARADERLWAIAQTDARVMADLQAAISRNSVEPTVTPKASTAPKTPTAGPVSVLRALESEMPFADKILRQERSYYYRYY